MLDKIRNKFKRMMIIMYRKYFGRGVNPIYILKTVFELVLTLVIVFLVFYFLLPN
jgi:hypothetical protein